MLVKKRGKMGLGDLFKRKKDEDLLSADLGQSPGLSPDQGMNDPLMSNPGSFGQANQGIDTLGTTNLSTMGMQSNNQAFQIGGQDLQKDIQILSLKLDAIKSELDSMNQRIKNIESIAQKEQAQQRPKWY